jgi:hypothetical protein
LDPQSDKAGPATQEPAGIQSPKNLAPQPARPGNISLFPYLPPSPIGIQPLLGSLDYLQAGLAVVFFLMWFFFSFPNTGRWWLPLSKPFFAWVIRSIFIGGSGFGCITLVSIVQRKLEKEIDRVRSDMHRVRGEKYAPPTPESVEWLNAFVRTIWGLINPDMFVSIADMVEDIMQVRLALASSTNLTNIGHFSNRFPGLWMPCASPTSVKAPTHSASFPCVRYQIVRRTKSTFFRNKNYNYNN